MVMRRANKITREKHAAVQRAYRKRMKAMVAREGGVVEKRAEAWLRSIERTVRRKD